MKEGSKFIFVLALVLVLSFSFVSANILDDMWGKFTGQVIAGETSDGYWTEWQNRDSPSGSGDYEIISEALKVYGDMCEKPIDLECEVVDRLIMKELVDDQMENVVCNTDVGFYCKNNNVDGNCLDYKVRYFCGKETIPTCFDGLENGNEEGIDCGGSCEEECIPDTVKNLTALSLEVVTIKDEYNVGEKIELTGSPEFPVPASSLNEGRDIFGITGNVVFDEENFKDNFLGGQLIEKAELESPKFKGYIVEFESEPLASEYVRLKETAEKNAESIWAKVPVVSSFLTLPENVDDKLKDYSFSLENEHEIVKNRILSDVGIKRSITGNAVNTPIELKVESEFTKVFNGISLDVSPEEAKEIENVGGVKRVYPNYEVNAALERSVPIIGADSVWNLDANGNDCSISSEECLTGKGINIGILDTGIDYTHEDLGSGFVEENRNFEKINEKKKIHWLKYDVADQISMDKNKLAYSFNEEILIYDLNSKTTEKINLPKGLEVFRLDLGENYLAYVAENISTLSQISLFVYNLETKENIEVENFVAKRRETPDFGNIYEGGMGFMGIGNGYVAYSKEDITVVEENSFGFLNIYVQDFNSGEKIKITEASLENLYSGLVVSGDLVAYSSSSHPGYCYNSLEVYNVKTKEKKSITNAPSLGGVLDMKGSEVMYFGCGEGMLVYYLYNLETGEYERITPPYFSDLENEIKNQDFRFFSINGWTNGAEIGERVIYFTDDNAKKIWAYDRINKKYVEINPVTFSGDFDAEEENLCFLSSDKNIYCHKYNSSTIYLPPNKSFGTKLVGGYDFINNDDDPFDDHGHGTHVAAIAAGKGVLKGVAPDANLYAYKVLDSYGSGYINGIILAIERSLDPNQDGDFSDKLDVISLSLGGQGNPDDPMSIAIDRIVDAGVVAVVAAGNSGPQEQTIGSPGTARNAITVGAVDKKDKMADFSSKGPVIWKDKNGQEKALVKPDVVAPGVVICAAQSSNKPWNDRNCVDYNHVAISGTSMATPHVAGAAALLLQKNPGWSPEEIKSSLRGTGVDLGENIITQGQGRIDVLEAVRLENKLPISKIYPLNKIQSEDEINSIEISGKVVGKKYTLEYGFGNNPFEWIEIFSGEGNKEGVLTNWNISNFEEGIYSLKLVVVNEFGKNEDQNFLVIKGKHPNIGGWPLSLMGEENTYIGIISPVIEDLDNDGSKELVVITQGNYEGKKSTLFIIDKDGFFKANVPLDCFVNTRGFVSITDLNKDNFSEIIFECEEKLLVFNHFGEILQEFSLENRVSDEFYGAVISKDINNDGLTEFIYGGWNNLGSQLVVLDSKGENMNGFPIILEDTQISEVNTPALGNLDGDWSTLEIVILSHENNFDNLLTNIRAYDFEGNNLWNQSINSISFSEPVIGDLNNDGKNEIAFTSQKGIHILDEKGNFLLNKEMGEGNFHSNIALADLNEDGTLELVFGYDIFLYSLDYEGNILFEFKSPNWKFEHPPIIGDLDGDGSLDIISNHDYMIYALNSKGEILNNFPKPMDVIFYSSPSINDLDNDGDVELISSSNGVGEGKIYVWDLDAPYNPDTMAWPMFQHDPQHTGCYDCEFDFIPAVVRNDSKIINEGNESFVGNLSLILQKKIANHWEDYQIVVESEITILENSELDLSEKWNLNEVFVSEVGNYRVFGKFEVAEGFITNSFKFEVVNL